MGTPQAFLKRLLFRWKHRDKMRDLDLIKEGRLNELSSFAGGRPWFWSEENLFPLSDVSRGLVMVPFLHAFIYILACRPFYSISTVGVIARLMEEGADVYELDLLGRTPLAVLQEARTTFQHSEWWESDVELPGFASNNLILNTVETVLMEAMRKPILEAVKQQLEEAPKAQRRM